jgi:CRP-like cAMP-binding protein
VGGLIYLAQGEVTIRIDGRHVTTMGPGALIGEMTLIHGGPASADAEVTAPARVLILPRDPLLAILNGAPDVAVAVSHGLQAEVQRKLRNMNGAPAPFSPNLRV